MIPRYSRPEMAGIWSAENRFRIWFEIEALAAEAMAELGTIPADAARGIRERGAPRVAAIGQADLDRSDAIERETRHDVIAFLTWLGEGIGDDARFLHQGMTSSDVLDTCLAVQMTQAADLLISGHVRAPPAGPACRAWCRCRRGRWRQTPAAPVRVV